MIYLVSRNKSLFGSIKYKYVDFEVAMKVLIPLHYVQFDTETEGLDAHTKKLLTVQLGNKENQVVFDWQTLTADEKRQLKEYFESDRVFIGWNLMFDLCFMYVQDIWVKHILDGMVIEKLLWLGYDHTEREMSLKAAAMHYLGIDIDKTVRGKIINVGLTEEVVVYAAGDVTYLEDIVEKQQIEVDKQNLKLAVELECEFIKGLAYFKHCGVHLDIDKWRQKMEKDQDNLDKAIQELNEWVVNWYEQSHVDSGEDWDIQYPEMNLTNRLEIEEATKTLLKAKYIRSPKDDLDTPYGKISAFKKKIISNFVKVDTQGDLFSGFDTRPKCTINWSSSQQVIPLFEKLGIDVITFDKKTKKKKKSVNAKLLKPQAHNFPILPIFLKYQEAAKVVTTYGDNWIKAINPTTGRIHVEFHSLGTDTARVSSGGGVYKLNLQFGGTIV